MTLCRSRPLPPPGTLPDCDVLVVPEVANYFRVSTRTVMRRMIYTMPHYRVGTELRIRRADVLAYEQKTLIGAGR